MRIHLVVMLCLLSCGFACGGPTVWLDDALDAGSAIGDDGEAGAGSAADAATSEPPPVDAGAVIDSSASDDEPGEENEVEDGLEGETCSSDLDCLDGESARCDTAAGRCVQCLQASDCDGEEPLCDLLRGRCVECMSAADCQGGVACDPVDHECEL